LNNPNSGAAKAYFDAARRLRGEQFEVVVPAERVGLMGRLFGRRALA
jgi:septum site-determining protein MinD